MGKTCWFVITFIERDTRLVQIFWMFNTFNGLTPYFRQIIHWKHYGMKNRISTFNASFFLDQCQIRYRFVTARLLFFALNILFLTLWWIDFDLESFRDKLFTRKDYGHFELGFSSLTRAVVSDLTSFATISCSGMLITRIFSPRKYLKD